MRQTNTVISLRSSAPSSDAFVFVIDQDKSVREYLESLIARAGWQPMWFNSAKAFLAYPRLMAQSCLVSDISPPDLGGLQLQGLLANRHELSIIFTTSRANMPVTVQAMKAGAVEFLSKPLDEEALLNALRQALERSREALHREAEMRVLHDAYDSLSGRERQVMEFVVQGVMNKRIGAALGLAVVTVKAHRSNLMRKMRAHSLAELVTMAVSLGVVPVRNRPRQCVAGARPASRPYTGEDRLPPNHPGMNLAYPLGGWHARVC